jgi:hypothetical protein
MAAVPIFVEAAPAMANSPDALPAPSRQPRRFTRAHRPDIKLPDGKILKPRARFADEMGVSERTIKRLNPLTTYISNVAYVESDATLQLFADSLKQRNQPPRGKIGAARQRKASRKTTSAEV